MDAIDKILGDIHYESSGLTARLVVQHDIDGMGNHHGTGTLEIVVEKDGRLEYVGAIAAFESPASKPTMPTMIGRERKPFSSLPSTNADLIVYFSEANLPAEPAKTAAACLAVRNVYDEALARLKALPKVETSFTDSLTTAIRDAEQARAAEAARAVRSFYINSHRRPGPEYLLT